MKCSVELVGNLLLKAGGVRPSYSREAEYEDTRKPHGSIPSEPAEQARCCEDSALRQAKQLVGASRISVTIGHVCPVWKPNGGNSKGIAAGTQGEHRRRSTLLGGGMNRPLRPPKQLATEAACWLNGKILEGWVSG